MIALTKGTITFYTDEEVSDITKLTIEEPNNGIVVVHVTTLVRNDDGSVSPETMTKTYPVASFG